MRTASTTRSSSPRCRRLRAGPREGEEGETFYQRFVGKDAIFNERGSDYTIPTIPDGTSEHTRKKKKKKKKKKKNTVRRRSRQPGSLDQTRGFTLQLAGPTAPVSAGCSTATFMPYFATASVYWIKKRLRPGRDEEGHRARRRGRGGPEEADEMNPPMTLAGQPLPLRGLAVFTPPCRPSCSHFFPRDFRTPIVFNGASIANTRPNPSPPGAAPMLPADKNPLMPANV